MILKDFWIQKIYVVALKRENKLNFTNLNRAFDGFVYFKSGNGNFSTNNKNFAIKSSDFVFLNKGQKYNFNVDGPCEYYTVAYDLSSDDNGVGISVKSLPIVFNNKTKLIPLLEDLNLCFYTKNLIKCREIISNIIIAVTSESVNSSLLDNDNVVEKSLSYIFNNYRKKISVNDIAKHCNISESYLRSKFKSKMGKSITEYVEDIKINEAKILLESGFFTIKEISSILGYYDVYHFTKRFTMAVGDSPSKYKKSFYTKK